MKLDTQYFRELQKTRITAAFVIYRQPEAGDAIYIGKLAVEIGKVHLAALPARAHLISTPYWNHDET